MKLWVNHLRKDNKINCTYGFDNGKRITKVRTIEQLKEDINKYHPQVIVHISVLPLYQTI